MAFCVAVVGLFIILSISQRFGGALSTHQLEKAVQQAMEIDRQLGEPDVDWDGVGKSAKRSPLAKFLKETKRFDATSNLYLKVQDTVEEAKKRGVGDVQAVILSRTLLRAATLHLIATLRGAEKPESALSIEDRKTRVRALAAPALDFAAEERNQEPAGPACEQAISRRLDAWRANPNAQTADAAVEALDGMFANVILSRLRTWKALRLAEQEQRRQAVVLQAEMRQIFYIIYPRAFERDREGAWKTLTEFTNDPKQMDAAFIAKTVKTDFADALASVRGESRE